MPRHESDFLNFFSFNAQSLCNKLAAFEYCISNDFQNSVICVCETWLMESISSALFSKYGFHVFRADRPTRGGGILVLVPTELQCSLIYSERSNEFEAIVVEIRFAEQSFHVCTIYRPPGANDSTRICSFLDHVLSVGCPCIITGDLNLPHVDYSNFTVSNRAFPIERDLVDRFVMWGLSQSVLEPMHGENILDVVLYNQPYLVSDVCVLEPFVGSDHSTVNFHVGPFNCNQGATSSKQFRCFWRANYDAINEYLLHIDWSELFSECISVHDFWCTFKLFMHKIIDTYVPLVHPRQYKESWSVECRKLYNKQKQLHRKFRQARVNRYYYYVRWKQASIECRRAFRRSQYDSELRVLRSGNNSIFWSFIHKCLVCHPKISTLVSNGAHIMDDKDKCAVLNTQFCSVFTPDNAVPINFANRTGSVISHVEITPELVYAELCTIRPSMSCGPDGIPNMVLHKLAFPLAYPLSLIMRISMLTGEVQYDWHCVNITAIHKSGNAHIPVNYHPISLTSTSCRVMEHVIKAALLVHLHLVNVISSSQFGFCQGSQ